MTGRMFMAAAIHGWRWKQASGLARRQPHIWTGFKDERSDRSESWASARHLPAMLQRPALGILKEGAHGGDARGVQPAGFLGGGQYIPPGGEAVQPDADGGEAGDALGEDAV